MQDFKFSQDVVRLLGIAVLPGGTVGKQLKVNSRLPEKKTQIKWLSSVFLFLKLYLK